MGKTRGFARVQTQWHSSSGRWCEGGAVRRAATCLPHPWQERPPRARTSPPGGWSSPVKRTCQQTAGFQTISYFIRWLTKVIVHRLLLHPWGNNLWDDAWRHKNRLREGIFGEYEELAIVKNAANKPAQHSRGDIRLGEKGAEA